jgi:predicted peroxiredoxin
MLPLQQFLRLTTPKKPSLKYIMKQYPHRNTTQPKKIVKKRIELGVKMQLCYSPYKIFFCLNSIPVNSKTTIFSL